jgi:hypothetical protein
MLGAFIELAIRAGMSALALAGSTRALPFAAACS